MATIKRVVVEWNDEPGVEFTTLVSVDEPWNPLEDEPGMFFYFANPEEFEQAKQKNTDLDFEFRIIREIDGKD